jgi:hypothetical protein
MDSFIELQDNIAFAHENIVQACKRLNEATSPEEKIEATERLKLSYEELDKANDEYNQFCFNRIN